MSGKINLYATFTSSSQEDLDLRVAAAIEQGWEPQGGLAIGVAAYPDSNHPNGETTWAHAQFLYGQAVVRREVSVAPPAPAAEPQAAPAPEPKPVRKKKERKVSRREAEAIEEARRPHDPERVNFEMLPAPAGYVVVTMKDHDECEDAAAAGWLMLIPGEWVPAAPEKPSPLRTYLRPA